MTSELESMYARAHTQLELNLDLSELERDRYAYLHVIHELRVEALQRRAKLQEDFKKELDKLGCCGKLKKHILRELNIFD